MKNLFSILFSLVLVSTAYGCGDATDAENAPEPTEESFFEIEQARAPYEGGEVDYELVGSLQEANTASAFRFYRKLRTEEQNLVFSPFSFSRVFAGYYNGEREAAAFEALFGFTPENGSIDAWNQTAYLAEDRSEYDDTPEEDRSLFRASDIYWVDVGSTGTANRDAFDRIHTLQLKADPEGSRKRINDWVESESKGLLKEFLEPGLINVDTEAVATNLVYFVGAWTGTYKDATLSFQGLDGTSEISGFTGSVETHASVSDDVTVVRIPYAHGYDHWIIMPDEDFETFANSMDELVWADLKNSTDNYEVTFTVPEFKGESKPDMVDAITDLREETGTTGGTLSGAYLETYVHQAAIEFTKEGTRAAAASAVIEYENNAPEPPPSLEVTIDRPFIHAITDAKSGNILFLGEYTGAQ